MYTLNDVMSGLCPIDLSAVLRSIRDDTNPYHRTMRITQLITLVKRHRLLCRFEKGMPGPPGGCMCMPFPEMKCDQRQNTIYPVVAPKYEEQVKLLSQLCELRERHFNKMLTKEYVESVIEYYESLSLITVYGPTGVPGMEYDGCRSAGAYAKDEERESVYARYLEQYAQYYLFQSSGMGFSSIDDILPLQGPPGAIGNKCTHRA